jgi:hypothetical protein
MFEESVDGTHNEVLAVGLIMIKLVGAFRERHKLDMK